MNSLKNQQIKGLIMQNFTYESTRYTVKPENVTKYRALLEKPKKHKAEAHKAVKTYYPQFQAGMSTSDYVDAFNRLNNFDQIRIKCGHTCENYYKPAPMFDSSYPECVEDENPDYIAADVPVKQKRQTAKELKTVIQDALRLLSLGDIQSSQSLLMGAV